MTRDSVIIPALVAAMLFAGTAATGQAAEKTEGAPADAVRIVAASLIGGDGSDYLAGGGFLPDGRVVVGGTMLDASTAIAGKEIVVVGTDNLDEPPAKRLPTSDVPPAWGWRDPHTTPFIAILTPDLSTVERVVRLPWRCGSVTDLLVTADGIYATGLAGPGLDGLPDSEDVSDVRDWGNDHAWLAKFDLDLNGVAWTRTVVDAAKGPTLRAGLADGVVLDAGWRYVFSSAGARLHVHAVPKLTSGSTWIRDIDPHDHTATIGGHVRDGEGLALGGGWWSPFLHIAKGTAREFRLWNFPEALTRNRDLGIKISSASRFIRLHHDDGGTLYAGAWSHGLNHPLMLDPFDFRGRQEVRIRNFYSHGHGSSIYYHLFTIDPADASISRHISWTENHLFALHTATDGSTLMGLSGGNGDLLTEDGLTGGKAIFDSQVIVLTPDLEKVRFGTAIPECASVHLHVRDDAESMILDAQVVQGRHRVLVTTGARPEAKAHEKGSRRFAGGAYDGYAMILDLGPVRTTAEEDE